MILVNAEGNIMGRLASFAAKKALSGETVAIVNAEKAVVTGTKQAAVRKIKARLDMRGKGNPEKGPKFSRMPDKILRRSVRGMLPWKSSRGRNAYRLVKAYIGVPKEFEGKPFEEVKQSKAKEQTKFVLLGEVCKLLGARW